MGLLDFFKKNDKGNEQSSNIPNPDDTSHKYLGDLDKTKIIRQLCEVPKEKRDNNWQDLFLKNIATASFQCGNPQIIEGPDENRYFQLLLPEPNKKFECFVIEHMINDYLLEKGLGIVINANKTDPDWVLSYGDIVNYSVRKEFLSNDSMFLSPRTSDEALTNKERVRIGQPSEFIIPLKTRKVVREYFNSFGISPKICIIEWIDRESKFDLVFNVVPKMFDKKEHFDIIMGSVKWFFPRHYSIVCKDEDEGFTPL